MGRELGSFPCSIPPSFVPSHNMPMINTTSNWKLLAELHHCIAARIRVAGGGAGGDAPDAQASALGLPYGQPQPPRRLSPSWDTTNHGGVQREVSAIGFVLALFSGGQQSQRDDAPTPRRWVGVAHFPVLRKSGWPRRLTLAKRWVAPKSSSSFGMRSWRTPAGFRRRHGNGPRRRVSFASSASQRMGRRHLPLAHKS